MTAVCAGSTILIIDRPKPHLWIVLTDPTPHPGHVLVVMVVTQKPHSDTTTVLRAGNHPFIKHDSCVNYSTARTMSVTSIERLLKDGDAQLKSPLAPQLLTVVRQGLITSDFTVNSIREHFRSEFA